jgi:hypothetical protein
MSKVLSLCFIVIAAGFAIPASAQEKQALRLVHPHPSRYGQKECTRGSRCEPGSGLFPGCWRINFIIVSALNICARLGTSDL